MKRNILSLLTVMALTVNTVPFAVFAADEHENQVHVIVENTTFTPESENWDDKFWHGTLVDTWVDIDNSSTMMTCIVDAIESAGYTQEGAESNYISSINGMSAFDGGNESGWMGTLNDWFTNEGFGAFTVKDGELETGDEVRVMYTCAYGDDLGGSWGNSDTTVKEISFDKGTLYPAFDKDTHEYTLTVPSDTDSVLVTPTASNKNYQVRTRIGDTVYKRTAQVPVSDDTSIVVECNYEGSLSMNGAGEENSYTIKVHKAQNVSEILNDTLTKLANTVTEPKFGTGGGEWTVLSLARAGYFDKDSDYFKGYYDRIVDTVNETAASVNKNGALHSRKYTENSRLIIALSAIGKDAHSVGDWDIIAPLEDFDATVWQGINGPVFALIALDTHNYKTTDTTIRQQYIDEILSKEIDGGGWSISGSADPDMTAMALQALAPYKNDQKVSAAVERGINKLSSMQKDNGGYASWGSVNSESTAQVIVACTALGIDPNADPRFVKNGHSAVDALLEFYDKDSTDLTFRHIMSGTGNAMATDQASYALVAYQRFIEGKNSLYDMTDVELDSNPIKFGGATLSLGGNIGVNFYMELDNSVISDSNAYMQFELPDGTMVSEPVKDAEVSLVDGKEYYVFSCEVSAKEMSDKITAKMISGNNTLSKEYTYSVKEYADNLIDGNYTSEEKNLVNTMLSYGNYAKAYFSKNNLTASTELNNVTTDILSGYAGKTSGKLSDGVKYYGSSLLLESDTKLRHYFKVADGTDVSGYNFSGNKGNYYYIDIADIPSHMLDQTKNVAVGDYTISYSPLSYAYAVINSENSDESLRNVVKALYLYNQAAVAYKK